MADRGRGGNRQPQRPAAVSTPRSGARTDGGPADKQPIRVASGGKYGERQASEQLQAAAPMAAGGEALQSPPSGMANAMAAGQLPQGQPDVDVFGPTKRPGEPIQAAPVPQQPPSADLTMRQLVQAYPSPWMLRLLRRSGG